MLGNRPRGGANTFRIRSEALSLVFPDLALRSGSIRTNRVKLSVYAVPYAVEAASYQTETEV